MTQVSSGMNLQSLAALFGGGQQQLSERQKAGKYDPWAPQQQTGFMDILKQLQGAQDAANQANEQRYQDILGSFENLGQAGMARIGRAEEQTTARGMQDLTSRGLGSTTLLSGVARGAADDAELQRQQLQGGIAQQKAGVMERRTDQGPDLGMYMNLLQSAASAQKTPEEIRTAEMKKRFGPNWFDTGLTPTRLIDRGR